MNRASIAGAWFGDTLPSGEFVVSAPGQPLQTDRGPVPLPPGETLQLGYLALSPDGTKFAGQPHSVNRTTFEYVHGVGWGTLPFVTGAGIYDAAGNYVDLPDSAMGMGFLTDDGRALKETECHGPHAHSGLFNFTEHRGYVVGAPQTVGLHVYEIATGITRVLDPSEMAPIRPKFHVRGDRFAITYTRGNDGGVQIVSGTIDELRDDSQLQRLAAPSTPTGPVDPPPPPPPPEKDEPPMPTAPNRLEVVRQVIAESPDVNRMEDGARGEITRRTVIKLGGHPWGRKDRDQDPSNHNESDDALCYRLTNGFFEIYDILSGGDGSAQWDYKGTFRDGENGWFREVTGSAPTTPTDPTGPNNPPPPPAGGKGVLETMQIAIAELLTLTTKQDARLTALDGAVNALNAELAKKGGGTAFPKRIALRSDTGGYLSVRHDRGGIVTDERPERGPWEELTIEVIE